MGRTADTNKKGIETVPSQEHENFKLTRQKKYDKSKDMLLRAYVPNETYELFLKVQKETNLTMPTLSGMCIEYALKHLELLDPR